MKRKYANNPGWKRILQHRFYYSYLNTPAYKGHVTLYCMDAVRDPLFVEHFHQKICIVDAGYSWLKQFPAGEQNYTVTTHFDEKGQVIAWYIDICRQTGGKPDQIPWMEDLYLDLFVSPFLGIEIKDEDELLAARESGEITGVEFDLAWSTANKLIEQIQHNQLILLPLSHAHRTLLLNDPGAELLSSTPLFL